MGTDRLAPWDSYGLVHHPNRRYRPFDRRDLPIEWLPIEPFTTNLLLVRVERASSAIRFHWEDYGGQVYPMFWSDFLKLLEKGTISKDRAYETWIPRMHSGYYGITIYDGNG